MREREERERNRDKDRLDWELEGRGMKDKRGKIDAKP